MSIVKTAESVCAGHPDKLCDQIADQILDDILTRDPDARVAVEVMATGHKIIVAGEITTSSRLRIRTSVQTALRSAGYVPWRFLIYVWVHRQSPDIAAGVTASLESRTTDTDGLSLLGAGDQGTVYGYATCETPERLPMPLVAAHLICRRLETARTTGLIDGLKPDGKAQVSIEYSDAGVPERVAAVVVSVQHDAAKDPDEVATQVRSLVVEPVLSRLLRFDGMQVLVNPSGRFVAGGPAADTGLTGRKLMVDTYGGLGPHGGGAFSGKDPSKVDRSGAYMARLIAKTVVDAHLARECQVAISYAIGCSEPVAFGVDTLGTGTCRDADLTAAARTVFDLRPEAIIRNLDLRAPQYHRLATYGHLGRDGYAWENTTGWTDQLRQEVQARC